MSLTTDIFKHCSPAIRTDIERCGTLSMCTATHPESVDELETVYKADGDYRIFGAMLTTTMEVKACGAVQNSLQDFFMANLKNMKKGIQLDQFSKGVQRIKPFILADQKRPINNVYWRASGGTASGENWRMDFESRSGIPADVRSFTPGKRLFVKSKTEAGAMNIWAGVILADPAPAIVGGKVRVYLSPQNAGSEFDVENPVSGITSRGPANVGRTESFCDDEPAYINNNLVDYWMSRAQTTICNSERVREWRKAVSDNNPLYKKLFDLSEAASNGQKLAAFQNSVFEDALWGQPISANQNLSDYRNLPVITDFIADSGLGISSQAGGGCDGYKANAIGWLQQLARCRQVYDALGEDLDLWSLMDAIYLLSRVRQGVNSAGATEFDLLTDSDTAGLIELGFIALFKARSSNTMVINMESEIIKEGTNKEFGFYYRRFRLVGKTGGITLNIITHRGLDDWLAEWQDMADQEADSTLVSGGRAIWLLDMTGIYIGMIDSVRDTRSTGNIRDLVKVDAAWACVEHAPVKETMLVAATYVPIVECPAASLLIWNLGGGVPNHVQTDGRPNYQPSDSIYNEFYDAVY